MTELETLLLKKLSEFSSFQEKQSDALRALFKMQSIRLDELSEQVQRLSAQLEDLSSGQRD